jgi:hypothetical protein
MKKNSRAFPQNFKKYYNLIEVLGLKRVIKGLNHSEKL